MSARTYVIAIIGALAVMFLVLRQVRQRRLRAKYALLWLSVAVIMTLLAVIPDALDRLAGLAGVSYGPALLLVMGLAFFAFLCLHFSAELSRLEERTRVLAEETSLLRERMDRGDGPGRVEDDRRTADQVDLLSRAGHPSTS